LIHIGLVEVFHEENGAMFNRRSLMMGGLVMAAALSPTRMALALGDKPTVVFVGHEL
jgi:hypothetical protein